MSIDKSTAAKPSDAIVIDIVYAHPIDRVWRALTDSASLSEWLMENDFEPILGRRFTFRDASGGAKWRGIVECEIVELDPPHRLAFTWDGGNVPPTLVGFTLDIAAAGTLLRLEHSGFAAGGEIGMTIRDVLASGWDSKILRERLPALLDRMAAEESPATSMEASRD